MHDKVKWHKELTKKDWAIVDEGIGNDFKGKNISVIQLISIDNNRKFYQKIGLQ